jgi:hypothetical protein
MARAKDLASLAALAGLGYALSKKGDTKDTSPGPGRQSLGAGYDSPGTSEEPRRQITDYIKEAPKDPREAGIAAANDVRSAPPKPRMTTNLAPAVSDRNEDYGNEGINRGARNKLVSEPSDKRIKLDPSRRNLEANMSRGSRAMPSAAAPFKGGQPGYDEAGNFLGGRRGYDEAGNPMKRGGTVKMASGGMTASRRADGIASKGKTRGKIC